MTPKNKRLNRVENHLLVLILALATISCQSQQTPSNPTAEVSNSATWTGNMRDMQQELTRVLPMVMDKSEYENPANQQELAKEISHLVKLSKTVSHNSVAMQKDPSVKFISQAFVEDLERVDESFRLGKKEFARYNLMNVTAYCIECHTRTSMGPSFQSAKIDSTLQKLTGMERGEYLLATRQYDAAFAEFSQIIQKGLAGKYDFFTLDKAVRYALAITVKYQKDPKKSLEIVHKVRDSQSTPYYLKQNAKGWELAIREWKKEKKNADSSVSSILKRCDEWVRKGQRMQVGFVDRGGDIYFLRALSDLHLILSAKLTPDQLGEALYMTGLSYEAIRDLSIWTLHENYYESCIRKVPHSNWSKKCFKNYEESIYFGFTGSSGTRVPDETAARLKELKSLAFSP